MFKAVNNPKLNIIRLTEPLTKFGIVFAVVDLIFVPNCSAAIETNSAQYPVAVHNKKHIV